MSVRMSYSAAVTKIPHTSVRGSVRGMRVGPCCTLASLRDAGPSPPGAWWDAGEGRGMWPIVPWFPLLVLATASCLAEPDLQGLGSRAPPCAEKKEN